MQTVPSLVGTGTAAAAAAVGLVFGQPPESEAPWSNPIQHVFPRDYDGFRAGPTPPRPSTSAAPNYHPGPSPVEDFPYASFRQLADAAPGPLTSHPTSPTSAPRPLTGIASPKSGGRRHSFIRQGDVACQPIAENVRDSVSSRDSWIRRLSLRPVSQHGSRRSSILGPDSSSMTFSHGSGVPMLGQSPTAHASPNKLVKRATSGQNGGADGLSRRGSKSQVLTLRRPATSHQRSATMQQFQNSGAYAEPLSPDVMLYTFENAALSPASPAFPIATDSDRTPSKWTSFFHTSRSASSGCDIPGLPPGSSYQGLFPRRRLMPAPGNGGRAYLTKASDIAEIPLVPHDAGTAQDESAPEEKRESSHFTSESSESTDSAPDRRARRSLSLHFSSASQWIARTGSVRRPRRSTIDAKSGGSRYGSDNATAPLDQAPPPVKPGREGFHAPPSEVQDPARQQPESDLKSADLLRTRKRNSSSPLPPLNRLSSFNLDVTRIGVAMSTPTGASRPLYNTPINYSHAPSATTHSRGPSGERSVTLAGSDTEARDGMFADDEDADFRSDGMYDSFRTGGSSVRMRSVETPLESMYDDSPPSTASNNRTKRLSIQEMLGHSWDGETKITEEEDEGAPTPIKSTHLVRTAELAPQEQGDDEFALGSTQQLSFVTRDFGRLSFDDDDDDDWARDDEDTLSNHLSPPSSTNSRRVSPTLRQALRNISGNSGPGPQRDSLDDRPRSNIFDWAEPLIHDKYDTDLPRPKTVHGKQELDLRGGRSTSRKAPGAAHVRSQSVPVVHDPSDGSKPTPKFGTWGLGTKTVSEDWDDDFEFEGDEAVVCSPGGKDSATSFSMVVPASIQATQPSVRAHSGQIRELSLLVNDLKRLCRHGRDLDILSGPMTAKWAEAESIIALASPDEDEPEDLGSSKPSMDLDRSKIDDRFLEEGFDGPLLDHADDPFGIPEPEMSRTAVVRERHSPRRRSVFSPDDDIFGNWPLVEGSVTPARPRTPSRASSPSRNSTIISTVIEAMKQQQQKSTAERTIRNQPPAAAAKTTTTTTTPPHDAKLFFDTNSLQELVKRAGQLRDALSDAVRRAELLTQSPAGTPRRERHATPRGGNYSHHHHHHQHHHQAHPTHQNADGSPAFTRVFVDPASTASVSSSPPRRLPNSHSTPSMLSRTSVESPRMQLMTVS